MTEQDWKCGLSEGDAAKVANMAAAAWNAGGYDIPWMNATDRERFRCLNQSRAGLVAIGVIVPTAQTRGEEVAEHEIRVEEDPNSDDLWNVFLPTGLKGNYECCRIYTMKDRAEYFASIYRGGLARLIDAERDAAHNDALEKAAATAGTYLRRCGGFYQTDQAIESAIRALKSGGAK